MPGPEEIRIEEIGAVTTATDLSREMKARGARAHVLFNLVGKGGKKYTVASVEGLGLTIVSRQSDKVLVIDGLHIAKLAEAAGIDQAPVIIVPSREVRRG
jgi:hypothetical protein